MSEVETECLFEARVQLEPPPLEVGDTPSGNIRTFYVKGGTFNGPELTGTVLPGCVDWVTIRPDGSCHLDTFRACPEFETSDERYAWLNGIVAVTRSRTGDGGVIHRVFQVL